MISPDDSTGFNSRFLGVFWIVSICVLRLLHPANGHSQNSVKAKNGSQKNRNALAVTIEKTKYFENSARADTLPPYSLGHRPSRFSANVALNSPVEVVLKDDLSGIDQATIRMSVNNKLVNSEITGIPESYFVSFQPPQKFRFNDTIRVAIEAADLAENPNRMPEDRYYFTTIVDTLPPFLTDFFPRNGALDEPANIAISFNLHDDLAGVDKNSILVYVDEQTVFPEITGDSTRYCIRYQPEVPFERGQEIRIRVSAQDFSNPPNVMKTAVFCFSVKNDLPDLAAKALVTKPAAEIRMNELVMVGAEIQNHFADIPEEFYVSIFQNGIHLADTLIYGLPADSSIFISTTTHFPKGEFLMKVVADSRDHITEANEINNYQEIIIKVNEGNLLVRPNPFTPNGDGFNDDARFIFSQLNLANPVLKLFTIENQNFITFENGQQNQFCWDGRDADGKNMPPGVYLYLLEDGQKVVAKGYVVLAR